jgi:HK97 family phage prohead protease
LKENVMKTYDAALRKSDGNQVKALVSVFGNTDADNERMMPGAFTNTLRKWRQSGDPIPCTWSNQSSPEAQVGFIDPRNAREAEEGLVVTVDFDDTAYAKQVLDLVRERRVTKWAIAFDVVRKRKAANGVTELLEVSLVEIGPCLRSADDLSGTLSRKSGTSLGAYVERVAREAGLTNPKMLASLRAVGNLWTGHGDPAYVKAALHRVVDHYTVRTQDGTTVHSPQDEIKAYNRAIEAVAGRKGTSTPAPDLQPEVVADVPDVIQGETITTLSSYNAEADPAEGETFSVRLPILTDDNESAA